MADYTIRVEADTRDSQDKVDKLDKRLNDVERPRKIEINLPSLQESINGVKTLGSALKQAFEVARMIPGNPINDIQQVGDVVGEQAKKVASAVALIGKATPTNILGNSFNVASESAVTLSKNVANLGYTVFGVTQSVNILKSAFGGFFDETIGREIRLQETLLRTKTTLVSTADVAVNGKRLTDPYEAILKLEKPIEKTVENIRLRSLDIAGTTSDAIIQTFGVVAGQIGQIGGSMKDAEDLAISFAGALGTLGLSDPMFATQEIRSILTGNIDQNSVLARSLGLTNEEVAKAKKSADGLVGYLQKRLEAFTAGQSIAARGFAGITSNIQEVQQELSRVFGKPFLQPMLDGLTKVYERLQLVTASLKKTREGNPIPGPAVGIADALGRTGNAVVTGVAGAALQAPSLTKLTQRAQYEGFERVEKTMTEVFLTIQATIDKMRPMISAITEEAIRAGTAISKGLGALAVGFAEFKFEQFKYSLQAFTQLAQTLNSTVVPALEAVLKVYGLLLSNTNFQKLAQFTAQWSLLERLGVLPAIRGFMALQSAIGALMPVIMTIPKVFQWLGTTISGVFNAIIAGISNVSAGLAAFGVGVVNFATLAIRWFTTLAFVIARDVGLALVQLANWLRRTYPELAKVAIGVSDIGRSFLSITLGIERAQVSMAKFAINASQYLASLEVSTERVKGKFAELGAGIQSALGVAGRGFMGLLKNIAQFLALQLAIQAAVTLVVQAINENSQRQKNLSDQTRAELAIRRLSTAYKDLGDNATLAAKKAKEFEDAVVSNRLSDVTKRVEELSSKIREYENSRKEGPLARLWRGLTDTGLWKTSKELQSFITPEERKTGEMPSSKELATRAEIQRLNAERRKLAQEAQTLLKFQEQADAQRQSKEEVEILGKERKQLEKELADYRKQLNKEITDNEFNFRQERLQIEQNAREAQRAAESAALGRSIEQSLSGLSGFRRQFAEILGTYQKRLFDAQTESQKRQFDLARQKERMEKNLADYKLRLEEQTVKLRQKMTDYSAKMTKWENDERLKTSRRVLQEALKAGEAYAGQFVLLPEEREKFQNAAASRGLSAQRVLALAKTLTPGEIPSTATPAALLDYIKENLPAFYRLANVNSKESEFRNLLTVRTTGLGQSTAAAHAMESAGQDLNSAFWRKLTPSPPPKSPGLENLLADNARATRSYEANQNAIIATTESLYKLQDALARQQIEQDRLASITKFFSEGMRTAVMIQDEQRAASDQAAVQRESLMRGSRYVDPFQLLMAENRRRLEFALDEMSKTLQGQAMTLTTSQLMKAYDDHVARRADLVPAIVKTDADRQLYNTVTKAIDRAINDQVTSDGERTLRATGATNKILTDLSNLILTFETESISIIQKIQEALLPDDPVRRRVFEANRQIDAARRTPEFAELSRNPQYLQNFNIFATALQTAATKLGELTKATESFVLKVTLIKDTAATLTEGFKSTFKAALSGEIKGFGEMMDAIRDRFTNAFTEWAFKPIQEGIEQELRRWFNVDNEAERLAELQKTYTEQFTKAVSDFASAVNTFSGKPETPPNPGTAPSPEPAPSPGAPPGPPATSASPLVVPFNVAANSIVPIATGNFNTLERSLQSLSSTAASTPKPIEETTKNLQNFMGGMATVAAGIAGIVAGIQQLGKKEGGGARNTLLGLSNIFIGLGTTLIGGGKIFRAAGGPVSANSPYVVGEEGPEWFVPSRSGTILPNGVGLGGGNVNSVVNVNISDSGTRTDNNQASQLGRMIDSAVVNIINRERRPGGLLTSR